MVACALCPSQTVVSMCGRGLEAFRPAQSLLVNGSLRRSKIYSDQDDSAPAAPSVQSLVALPPADLAMGRPIRDESQVWAELASDFERELFPLIRSDARMAVSTELAELVDELRLHPPPMVLRHGDFGGGNILHDPASLSVTGVIDFDFAGLGDPALDLAALSTYGEAFLARGLSAYPELAAMLPRARRYRATFALQQALYALRAGDQDELADGIADYI